MAPPPTVLEQVIETAAIDNLHRVGDVGSTNEALLRRLLPHCTAEQLERIKTSTKGRDLSSITDELWRQHYGRKFGEDTASMVQERITSAAQGRMSKWRRLYNAKTIEQEGSQMKGVGRLKELYKEENAKKTRRQIQFINKKPPAVGVKRARTATLPASGPGSSGGRASPKKPAAGAAGSKEVAGWTKPGQTGKLGQTAGEVQKKGGPERGRLMRKARADFSKRNLMMRPALPARTPGNP